MSEIAERHNPAQLLGGPETTGSLDPAQLLERDLSEAREHLAATTEILAVLGRSGGDLDAILGAVVETVRQLCRADTALVYLVDGDVFRVARSSGVPSEVMDYIAAHPFTLDLGTLSGRVALARRPLQIEDVLLDESFGRVDAQRVAGFRTVIAAPLVLDKDLVGVLNLWRLQVQPFDTREMTLLTAFASQAAMVIRNAHLVRALELRTRQLETAGQQLAAWNESLEARVAEQVAEVERSQRLRRFLSPQVAELVLRDEDQSVLEGHRREIVVLFCDLRGFTAFAETSEPEEVMQVLREYHATLGDLGHRYAGTLERFTGDGLMVFFNDPLPCDDPADRAVAMAVEMRAQVHDLALGWSARGHDLGFSIGIAQGFATLGRIGFEGRYDYAAIGSVTNLAARLCAEAAAGQILVTQRVKAGVGDRVVTGRILDMELRGFSRTVRAHEVLELGGTAIPAPRPMELPATETVRP